ncbi:2'-5' RNA ligase family protein [Mucilaginibacter sp. Bleaf8]|uniref:2'-5' RNA ligase family protein n=1 Tax=Mucilaginibacter sp. Bleaf8 TaxID=2834430 RepID=UPI001BD039A3|nr:2'-5' RNA ligase family protein [Mucilaginibacter sp. Bleaf8]MBS7563293.1 2'-5' RNA ligase family protein [Mucilaginibacter sp. Bleaf8]
MNYADYLFLLPPNEHIKEKIAQYKQFAGNVIGSYPGMNATAHISVMHLYRQKPYFIKPFMETIRHGVVGTPAIILHVDGFQFFTHKDETMTIYAAIKPTYQTDNWFSGLKKKLKVGNQPFTPHLTILKTIPIDSFYKVWPLFKSQTYQDKFTVNRLFVLEKDSLNKQDRWKIHDEIAFR